MDESGIDEAECGRKIVSWSRAAGALRFLVNARDLQLERARVLHGLFLVPFLMYGSETMLWKEKERYRIRVVKIDKLRGLLVSGG